MRIEKLAKEVEVVKDGVKTTKRIILSEKEDIEEEVVSYFSNLFQGYHTSNGSLGNKPFLPNYSDMNFFLRGVGRLEDAESDLLTKEITLEEVR